MRFLVEPEGAETLDALLAVGTAVHAGGLDGIALSPTPALPSPLVAAAAVAACVPDILLAALCPLGDRHPLELAEEAVVVDLASGGRVVLVAVPAEGEEAHYAEALDLLRTATAAAPFRFAGARWTVPANLPQHTRAVERRTRVTPAPARARLELWTAGAGRAAGLVRGLGHVAGIDDEPDGLARAWDEAIGRSPAVVGAPRGRRERWTGAGALVDRLREGRAAFGQDWALVRAPLEAIGELGRHVRPRVQLDALPYGLEAHWDERRRP